MIYTVTFNPSLDYVMPVEQLKLGEVNRTSKEQMVPGGKGLNVSLVLKNLGVKNTALGFLAGFVGKEIGALVEKEGIAADFTWLEDGVSRINVKLKGGQMTEINAAGPDIPGEKVEELLAKTGMLQRGDVLVLAGSIPKSMPDSVYRDIMAELAGDSRDGQKATGAPDESGKQSPLIVVDATNDLLLQVLEYHPFLIKPNHHELGELFDVKITTKEEVLPYAKELQKRGAKNVLVSMGGKGAVLLNETGAVHMSEAPKGKVVNTVGAGDSMVAGFLAGWLDKKDYEYAFRLGLASGSASAFSEKIATKVEIEHVFKETWG